MLYKLLILILGYLIMVLAGYFIKIILKRSIGSSEDKNDMRQGIEGVGALIGMLERILIFSLVLVDQYAAISIVFAAKSIARFKELDNRSIAEYYLLGTFLSLTTAVIIGIIFRIIFGNIIPLVG
ncbi:putative protein [Methanobacterium congolense]|uniref:Uncharacterized protein n=2 Tax=Methanobacterium congolense TaxID=118062 RepID=A0A1D3L431_9EURY|nr:putative protein [Methanobacterium congolense]